MSTKMTGMTDEKPDQDEKPASRFTAGKVNGIFAAKKNKLWQIIVHNDYVALEKIWRKLELEGHCTVFQSYDWASCWYDAALTCSEAEPVIVIVLDKNTGPVWILPFCLYKKKGLRIISFADLGISDYAAPVIAPNAPQTKTAVISIVKEVFKALPPCDVIHFQKLVLSVESVPNPLLQLPSLERFPEDCHGIRVCEPWPVLKNKIMQSRLRSTIRNKMRKIKDKGEVIVKHHTYPEKLGSNMDKLMTMREIRFENMGRPEMPPMWRNFYYALASRRNQSLNVGITTMSVSGEVVATCFGLSRKKTYHAIIPAFEVEKWKSYRPGILLFDSMLSRFAENADEESYFDFSVGDHTYKKRFGSDSYPLYEWMTPRTAPGLVYYVAWRAKFLLRRYPKLFARLKEAKKQGVALKEKISKHYRIVMAKILNKLGKVKSCKPLRVVQNKFFEFISNYRTK